jgi:signal peptidase
VSAPSRRLAELAVGLVVIALWALTLRPASLGGPATYVVIRGDSMLPTFHSGDLVVLRSTDGYASGDIVGYRVPAGEVGAGNLVVHRLVSGDGVAGFTVVGDNNPAPDPWLPHAGDIAGKAWLLVPGLGKVVAFVHQPAAAGALAVSLLLMLVLAQGRSGRRRSVVPTGQDGRASRIPRPEGAS